MQQQQQQGYNIHSHHYRPSPMSPVALDRYDKAFSGLEKGDANMIIFDHLLIVIFFAPTENVPKKAARVTHDFQAMNSNELAVKKGDLVAVRRNINAHWVEVEDCSSGLVVRERVTSIVFHDVSNSCLSSSPLGFRAEDLPGYGAKGCGPGQV